MSSLRSRFVALVVVAALLVAALSVASYVLAARWISSAFAGEAAVDEVLGALAGGFAVLAVAAILVLVVVALVNLRPVGTPLSRVLAELDASDTARVDPTGLPAEIEPVVARTLALRQRLATSLAREREFTGHVAHELRTPLAVLQTGLELALRDRAPGRDDQPHLAELLETVEEMRRVIDNLLVLARIERGGERVALAPVRVRAVIDAVWERLAARAQARGLAFDDRVADDVEIPADPGKLRMIVHNLLANAVSYTERGGSIVVDMRPGRCLSVWDSGPQLDPEQLERIFDRLWRADLARTDATTHAGIGLSLARALAEQMGMALDANNVDDGGLRFTLRPRAMGDGTA